MTRAAADGSVPALLWTADLGNSALKVVLWDGRAPKPLARYQGSWAEGGLEGFGAWLEDPLGDGRHLRALVQGGGLCTVAGPERTADFQRVLHRGQIPDSDRSLEPGVRNCTRTPHTVGRDRLFAARAAAHLAGAGAVVVDVGTAMTVDAVAWEGPGGEPPRFLGGAIAPGPGLLARALALIPALPPVEPRAKVAALGEDTPSALLAGVVHGLRGAAEELSRRVGAEAGLAAAPRYLTGGARELLLAPWPFWTGDLRVEPDLVHLGLWLACSESLG